MDRAFAATYARLAPAAESGALGDHRRAVLEGIAGHVVDVGAGVGSNLRHLGDEVRRVTMLEPSPHMARRLHDVVAHAHGLPFETDVIEAPGEAIPLADDSADAVLCTLVLCTVDDLARTLAEIRRVLRPDGALVLIEHVRGDGAMAVVQRIITPVWSFFGGGCDPARPTGVALERAGFDTSRVQRHTVPSWGPAAPLLVGVARPS